VTALFSLTLLASAFLLFCIEPLVAKMLLPIAGGVPAVWSTCLVFFQSTLLAGYAFSHFTLEKLGARRQSLAYWILFPAALVALPIVLPSRELGGHPALAVLALLTTSVGVPFFVLSTLAPSLQRWFAATGHARAHDPYFLYAASNVGSLGALAAYPFLIEPSLDLDVQSRALRLGFVALAILCAACAWQVRPEAKASHATNAAPRIAWARRARWVLLAAIPSAELVAVTSYVTTAVAPAPLLWALPLAAYLVSFVVVFARRPIASHATFARRLPFAIVVGMLLVVTGANSPAWLVIALHVLVLFAVSAFCHGALAEDRPGVTRLAEFYTWMSLGGALGGAAAALGAPLILKQPIEYPVCLLLALACLPAAKSPTWVRVVAACAVAIAIASDAIFGSWATGLLATAVSGASVLVALALDGHPRAMTWALAGILLVRTWSADARGHVLVRARSFFGAFAVVRDKGETALMHGNTMHGLEIDRARSTPTLYYAKTGPIGDVLALAQSRDRPLRVALVGLGAGTLATYARPSETWRFFEIDPAVVRIAEDPAYFTFLHDAFGDHADVVVGDARIELQRDPTQWDLLVVDAFTSDAIPTHLLTREAFAMYRQKLFPGAMIAWHVSNRHLDLGPALAALMDDARWSLLIRDDSIANDRGKSASIWIASAASMDELAPLRARGWTDVARRAGFRVWTDQRASIVTVWK